MRKMKDSGIEWLGNIPSNWHTVPLKRNFTIYSGATPNSEKIEYWNGNIPWITPADYKTKDIYISHGKKFLTETGYLSCGTSMIPTGSIIFSKRAPIGSVAINSQELCTNQGCLSCVPKHNIAIKYYYYLMSVETEQFELVGSGTTFKEISANALANFLLPSPPIHEQSRIANFLDEKCALIDRLVERHQEVIEKLKAYRQSVISETVTRGLDPDAPMKDSGIPWIGKIPEGWKIDKIKYISKFNPGCSRHFDHYESVGYLPMECLKHGFMTPLKTKYEKITGALTCFEDGDIVLAKVTPCFENGNIAIAHNLENHTGFGSSELFVFRCSGYETRFLFYIFQNSNFMNECISTMTGTGGLKRVSSDFIRNCRIPVPDLQLQQQIADYLDEKCAKIDRIIHDKEQIISKLAEYKKSIIYEYVTGKKEVPAS